MSEPLDHGVLNVPLAKRGRSIDAQLDDWRREQRAQNVAAGKAAAALRKNAATIERVEVTRDDLDGATAVRTDLGWHKVVRVNAKSVTVPSIVGGSWTDRLTFDRILEVRS